MDDQPKSTIPIIEITPKISSEPTVEQENLGDQKPGGQELDGQEINGEPGGQELDGQEINGEPGGQELDGQEINGEPKNIYRNLQDFTRATISNDNYNDIKKKWNAILWIIKNTTNDSNIAIIKTIISNTLETKNENDRDKKLLYLHHIINFFRFINTKVDDKEKILMTREDIVTKIIKKNKIKTSAGLDLGNIYDHYNIVDEFEKNRILQYSEIVSRIIKIQQCNLYIYFAESFFNTTEYKNVFSVMGKIHSGLKNTTDSILNLEYYDHAGFENTGIMSDTDQTKYINDILQSVLILANEILEITIPDNDSQIGFDVIPSLIKVLNSKIKAIVICHYNLVTKIKIIEDRSKIDQLLGNYINEVVNCFSFSIKVFILIFANMKIIRAIDKKEEAFKIPTFTNGNKFEVKHFIDKTDFINQRLTEKLTAYYDQVSKLLNNGNTIIIKDPVSDKKLYIDKGDNDSGDDNDKGDNDSGDDNDNDKGDNNGDNKDNNSNGNNNGNEDKNGNENNKDLDKNGNNEERSKNTRGLTTFNSSNSSILNPAFDIRVITRALEKIVLFTRSLKKPKHDHFIDKIVSLNKKTSSTKVTSGGADVTVDAVKLARDREVEKKEAEKKVKEAEKATADTAEKLEKEKDKERKKAENAIIAKKAAIKSDFDKHIRLIKQQIFEYYKLHSNFVKQQLSAANKFIKIWESQKVENENKTKIIEDYKEKVNDLRELAVEFIKNLGEAVDADLDMYIKNNADLIGDDVYVYQNKASMVYDIFNDTEHKISSLYNNKNNIMDAVLDSRFIMIYVLKITSYLFLLLSLYLSEKIFSDMYMRKVYGEGLDPPNLLIYLGITLAMCAAFMLFVLTFLILIMYLFNDPLNGFIINGELIKTYIIDYIFSIVLIMLFGIIIGVSIQNKRYFRYKSEGLRGVRALKFVLMYLSIILFSIPFYSLF